MRKNRKLVENGTSHRFAETVVSGGEERPTGEVRVGYKFTEFLWTILQGFYTTKRMRESGKGRWGGRKGNAKECASPCGQARRGIGTKWRASTADASLGVREDDAARAHAVRITIEVPAALAGAACRVPCVSYGRSVAFGVARAATEWNGVLVRNVGRRDRRAVQGNACMSLMYDV